MAAQATKADIEALDRKLVAKLDATRDELRQELHATRDDLRSEIRANGVMLEDMRGQMRALAEVMTGLVGRTEVDERESQLSTRITVLESTIRDNCDDIRKNTRRIANVEKRLKRAR